MDWRDIKWFHEVVVHGSFSGAARATGTTQATISRRIAALEQELGVELFVRDHAGSALSEAGERLAASARAMSDSFSEFLRQHQGMQRERRTVVITCGPLIGLFLTKHLARLQTGVDGVDIDVKTTSEFLDLDKGEADIALRNKRPTKGQLVARQLVTPNYGPCSVFGARAFYAGVTFPDLESLRREPWAGYAARASAVPTARWVRDHIGDDRLAFRLESAPLILEVISQNRALAVLPRFVGAATPALVEVYGPIEELHFDMFMVRRERDTDERVLAVMRNVEALFE